MAYEKKPGDLAVFRNDRKEKESHPDYTITGLTLDGKPMKGALWLKEDRQGKKFMAGRIEVDQYLLEKQGGDFRSGGDEGFPRRGGGGGRQEQSGRGHRQDSYDMNDDIPFVRQAYDWEV